MLDLKNIQVISQVLAQSVAMDFYSSHVERTLGTFCAMNLEMQVGVGGGLLGWGWVLWRGWGWGCRSGVWGLDAASAAAAHPSPALAAPVAPPPATTHCIACLPPCPQHLTLSCPPAPPTYPAQESQSIGKINKQVLLQLVAENNIVMTDIINKLGVHERFDIAWKHVQVRGAAGCCWCWGRGEY